MWRLWTTDLRWAICLWRASGAPGLWLSACAPLPLLADLAVVEMEVAHSAAAATEVARGDGGCQEVADRAADGRERLAAGERRCRQCKATLGSMRHHWGSHQAP